MGGEVKMGPPLEREGAGGRPATNSRREPFLNNQTSKRQPPGSANSNNAWPNVHREGTRATIIRLHREGMSINEIARRVKGLIDRDTIKRWVREA